MKFTLCTTHGQNQSRAHIAAREPCRLRAALQRHVGDLLGADDLRGGGSRSPRAWGWLASDGSDLPTPHTHTVWHAARRCLHVRREERDHLVDQVEVGAAVGRHVDGEDLAHARHEVTMKRSMAWGGGSALRCSWAAPSPQSRRRCSPPCPPPTARTGPCRLPY